MTTTLIIPALNPDERLLDLVKEVRALRPHMQILIVDDGSDVSAGIIFDYLKFYYDCILCRHPENYGKGAAIKTGIGHIMFHDPGCTGFVTADADGQHKAADIIAVAEALERTPRHIILGTRDFTLEQVPFKSRWGNRITSSVFRRVTGVACADTQTGLRGIPAVCTEFALNVSGERFEYEMNFLLQAAGEGIPFQAVPIGTVYLDRNKSSHFRAVRDSVKVCGVIFRYCVSSLLHRRKKRDRWLTAPEALPQTESREEKLVV